MDYIIIDDEPDAIEVLKFHLNNIPFMELKATFRDPIDALDYLQKHTVDLLFLDINMPKLSGISFPKLLEKPPLIIFTTAYSEYALESYELKAIDYLLKPITFDRLLQAVLKAKQMLTQKERETNYDTSNETSEQTVFIKSGSEFHQVPVQNIKYIESDGNYVTFHTTARAILARYKLSEVKELLPYKFFIRTHRSYIVALRYIEIVKKNSVIIDKKEIPISSNYKEDVFSIVSDNKKKK
ncbi:LytR/AlgR family response regulator transcription factor [Tenacibaculum aiptasiae]|uniref:LytR/AlgR family response regulator transcription factor n=1 Tax=Tenacibaculum aiptasiae TaxID=426481 RepID=UPI002330490C|nr:LytTR family DNA-binding domain-containing protein [Tenacibaculum aiptasiae]